MLILSHIWTIGAISTWLHCHFDIFLEFLEHFLTFWHKISKTRVLFSVPALKSATFLRIPYSFKEKKYYLETKVGGGGSVNLS